MILFSLFVLKLQLTAFSILFDGLVFLPVFDPFLQPLFHKPSVSLEFIDLSTSNFLSHFVLCLVFFLLRFLSNTFLSQSLLLKLLLVLLHVQLLLWTVQNLKSLLEKLLSMLIVFLFRLCYFQSWLVVAHLSSYNQYSD